MTASIAPAPPQLWPARTVPVPRQLDVGRRSIRYIPPNIRDPRIHLSSVIITILFIGIGWLGFRLSIAQILVTMAACAAAELAIGYRRTGVFAWPASAFQTATSTALLFRVIGTENGDYWSMRGWHLFAIVGVAGVLTKYTIRFRTGHVFNPSNVLLVIAFLVLGSERVEPLDYWWAPFGWPMAAAYAVIIVGGLVICGRLRLLGLSAALWISLAAGLGLLALADHTMTTRYSLVPISGAHFWWIIMTSPEIMIFMFFMITDPRTVPDGRVARVAYGLAIGVVSALCIAPWQTEFGAKVGLLSGLVLVCMSRPLFDRYLPAVGSADDDPVRFVRRAFGRRRVVASATVSIVFLTALITVAGLPARVTDATAPPELAQVSATPVDPATFPDVMIDPEVAGISAGLATQDGARDLVAALAWNLQVEAEAVAHGDRGLLPAVTDGAVLHDLEAVIDANGPTGARTVPSYTFDTLALTIVFPGGFQRGPNAGVRATGTVEEVVVSADGAVIERSERPFESTFALRVTTDGRWLHTTMLPYDVPGGG
ncbi:MAG: hypothetical protein AB7L17_20800 [Ilumatobacteraceae bacterium]